MKEPNIVANFMFDIINAINKKENHEIKAGGVFIHASPYVSFVKANSKKTSTVELGDLLLIRTEFRKNVSIKRTAMIFQVKKTKSIPYHNKNNDEQYYLYSTWPTFTYTRADKQKSLNGKLSLINGKKRNISCNDICTGTKYLFINTNKKQCFNSICLNCNNCMDFKSTLCCCNTVTAIATPTKFSNYEYFSSDIINFIFGFGGKEFKIPPEKRKRNWDRVIKDLLEHTALVISQFTEKYSASKISPRGTGYLCCSLIEDLSPKSCLRSYGINSYKTENNGNRENKPPNNDNEKFDEEPRGMSIIEFEVSPEE